MNPALKAASASFAHLLGRVPKAAKAEEDERKKRDDETEEEHAKRMKVLDEEEARKAEEEEDEESAEDDKPETEDEKEKGKKAKKAEKDDKDDEEEDDEDGKKAAARGRERARCAAIFASPEAGKRPDLAAHLAFNTSYPRSEALALLRAAASGEPAKARSGLADRMAATPKAPVVASVTVVEDRNLPSDPVARAIVMAGKRARNEA